MEHIRAAIDKARQERQATGKSDTKPLRVQAKSGTEAGHAAVSEAWAALQTFDVNPKRLKRNRVLTYQANPDAAHFDVMRTKLLHEMRSNGWRRIAITSPNTKCGKSTISLNLAFSLARQSDIRVMVVELDLRRPSIARMLQLPKSDLNFAAALTGQAPAAEQIRRHRNNLAIAVSQHSAPDSAELLQSVTAAHTIDEIEALYQPEVMIFDMPPMLVVDDTMAFIDQVDATLLIGAAESSTLEEISRCKQDLATRTNLLGVVLNKCRYLNTAEGYDYGNY
jgi:protein-tyrosine kinase